MTLYSLKIKSNDTQYYRKSDRDWQSKTPVWLTKEELEKIYRRHSEWRTHPNIEVLIKAEPETYIPVKRQIHIKK